jgi:hypothetical protein
VNYESLAITKGGDVSEPAVIPCFTESCTSLLSRADLLLLLLLLLMLLWLLLFLSKLLFLGVFEAFRWGETKPAFLEMSDAANAGTGGLPSPR